MAEADAAAAASASSAGKKKPHKPDEVAHKKEMERIKKRMDELAEKQKALGPRPTRDEDAPKTPDQIKRDELSAALKALKVERDAARAARDQHREEARKVSAAIQKKDEAAKAARSAAAGKSVAELDAQIKKLQTQLESSNLSAGDEKRVVAEMDALKAAKATFSAQKALQDEIATMRAEFRRLDDLAGQQHRRLDEIFAREAPLKHELNLSTDASRAADSKRYTDRQTIRAEMDKLGAERRKMIGEYDAAYKLWFEATREEREALRVKREEEARTLAEERRKAAEERRRKQEEYEASLHPWQEQLDLCDALTKYLQQFVKSADEPAEAAAAPVAVLDSGHKLLQDRRDQEVLQVAGKKQPKKDKRGTATPKSRALTHAPTVLHQFLSLDVKVPNSTDAIPAALTALATKRSEYYIKPRPVKPSRPASSVASPTKANGAAAAAAAPAAAEAEAEAAAEEEGGSAAAAADDGAAAADEEEIPADVAVKSEWSLPEAEDTGEEATKKLPPPSVRTYDDDPSHGKPVPALDTLVYIQGSAVSYAAAPATMIVFWASHQDGDWQTLVSVSDLARRLGVQAVGISFDNTKEASEKLLAKLGKKLPELGIGCLKVDFPLAWDADKSVRTAFKDLAGLLALNASAVFVVDKTGTIVWREQFSQAHPVIKGQLMEQLRHIVAGEELTKNGPKPKVEEEPDDMAMGELELF